MTAALLLVHGFPFDHTLWSHASHVLSQTHRVIAPDLPGFGGTAPFAHDPAAVRVDDYARFLLARLDREGVDRAAVIGHSMGGYIAFALHRIAPQRIAGFALVTSRAIADTEAGRKTRRVNAARALSEGVEFLADEMSKKPLAPDPDPALVNHLRRIILRANPIGCAGALHAMAERPDSTAQLPKIAVPALVVAGRHDAIVPAAESEAMAQMMKDATLLWCERTGHMPMLEEPDFLADALAQFAAAV